MRTYYIFNINNYTEVLTKDTPYILFKSLESIYRKLNHDFDSAYYLYEQIVLKINKKKLNDNIIELNKNDKFYTFNNDYHQYNNKYKDEKVSLIIKNSFIIYESNCLDIKMLKGLSNYNFFICDFENKDYFWLDKICC